MALTWTDMSHRFIVKNKGSKKVYPEVEIKIKEDTKSIAMIKGDKEIHLNYDFEEDDKVEIDLGTKKVKVNGDEELDAIDIVKSDFFALDPGENKIIIIPSDNEFKFKYRNRWI